MFTYLSSDPVQEADIEILTSGPRDVVQYTNQPSNSQSGGVIPEATRNSSIPGGMDWTTWNSYRVDWSPTQSAWYVNGQSAANISFQVPRDPAGLIVNMWSDGGPWTGIMSVHDAAYLQIQYIEVVYNTTGPYDGSSSTTTVRPRNAEPTSVNGLSRRSGNWKARSYGAERSEASGEAGGAVDMLGKRDAFSGGCQVVCSVDDGVSASSVGIPVMLYNNTGSASSTGRSGTWVTWVSSIVLGSLVAIALSL
jgi:hypothetical protein